MKIAATCVAFAFGLAGAGALAQDAVDAMEKLRACSLLVQSLLRRLPVSTMRTINTALMSTIPSLVSSHRTCHLSAVRLVTPRRVPQLLGVS